MNYIYDILLNFNKEIYDFYEWNKIDKITHIKKIPIFRIKGRNLKEIINNNIMFNKEFLDKIKNKTEIFSHKNKIIKYAFLLTDSKSIIAININNNILYSKLLLEEEMDSLIIASKLKEINIEYKIKSKKIVILKTRKEIALEKNILKEINKNNIEELKYIYFEYFNKRCNDIKIIKKELIKEINNSVFLEKINNILFLKNV